MKQSVDMYAKLRIIGKHNLISLISKKIRQMNHTTTTTTLTELRRRFLFVGWMLNRVEELQLTEDETLLAQVQETPFGNVLLGFDRA